MRPDFWPHCGFNLTGRDGDGRLLVTDALLRAWWQRPEVALVDESCDAERRLHAALLEAPQRPVSAAELARLADSDARENYAVMLAWRERLLTAPTLEAAYLDIFRGDVTVPPIFIDQLAQIVVRGLLDNACDGLQARVAELFFRAQKVTLQEGAVMLADAETVNLHASGANFGDIGRLLMEAKIRPRRLDLDVIDQANGESYWARDEQYDTVLGLQHDGAALAAFCRLVERWVWQFYRVEVKVAPLRAIEEKQLAWHIGLDAEATAILNDLYRGVALEDERRHRILSLFRLDFADRSVVRPDVAGRPVYLACAMNAAGVLRVKPQNLLLNLPLASIS